MPAQVGFQAVLVTPVLALVQVVFAPCRVERPPGLVQLMPGPGQAFLMQLGDQARGFGIMQAGHAIKDFFGVVHPLGAGLPDAESGLPELVAHGVAISPRRFHDHGDRAAQLPEALDQDGGFQQLPFH